MKFAMLIHEPASEFAKRQGPEAGAYWAGWMAYSEALRTSGVMVGGAGLEPPVAATTLRLADGKRQIHDGPFADSKEQLGGFYLLDLPSLDVALDWAARCSGAPSGSIEIRPLLPPPPQAT
jgi:hypothetical protein